MENRGNCGSYRQKMIVGKVKGPCVELKRLKSDVC